MSLLPTNNTFKNESQRKLHFCVPFLNVVVWVMNVAAFTYHAIKGDVLRVSHVYSNLLSPVDAVYFVWIFVFCSQFALVTYGFFPSARGSSVLQRGVCLAFAIQGALFFAWYFTFSHSILTTSTILTGVATRMVWASFFRVYVHIFSPQSIQQYCGAILKRNWIRVSNKTCKKDVAFILLPLSASLAWYTILTLLHVNSMVVRFLPLNGVAQTACAVASLLVMVSISARMTSAWKYSDLITPCIFAVFSVGVLLKCKNVSLFAQPSLAWTPAFLREAMYYIMMALIVLFSLDALYSVFVSIFCRRSAKSESCEFEVSSSPVAQAPSIAEDCSLEDLVIGV